jgi:hypothetical protein
VDVDIHRTCGIKETRLGDKRPHYLGWIHWVQFCFKYDETLGNERTFIEFMINWNEWLDDPEAK